MQTNLTPRYLIIAAILGWAIYTLSPTWQYHNMSAEKKEELRTDGKLNDIESRIIRQGLDLKGGMYIVLEADIPTLMTNLASVKDERLESIISTTQESSSTLNLDFFTEFEKNVRFNEIKLSRYYHEYGASLDDIIILEVERSILSPIPGSLKAFLDDIYALPVHGCTNFLSPGFIFFIDPQEAKINNVINNVVIFEIIFFIVN